MKPKVYIAKPIPESVEKYIAEYCEYKIWDEKTPIPKEKLLEEIKDIDGLMLPKGEITNEFLDQAPKLKVVSNIAVGYDGFDIEAMKKHKVLGTHTPHVLDETVADTIFGLILMTARKLSECNHHVKKGHWNKMDSEDFFGKDVHDATLGIIGMGRIGEKVARRATQGFNMNVLYYNRSRRKDVEEKYNVRYSDMTNLLRESDFVLLMLPLTNSTFQFMGANEFKLMKTDAFFFNCSRGKTVDENALIEALKMKKISGAGLDVYEQEPINKDNPLLLMDNVVTLPHIGSATKKTRDDMAMRAAENLVAGVTGKTPPDVVKEMR
ncbi:Glyoxylate reductase (NADP(+)) [Lentibacillus sp. JNUCC-1]|uniref:2-hydroxyacid dehydrogenase n=1 Tax=Lentibacillus sp. JNUCC-1 TaxID=2654513 RepID=UPI0012E8BBAB|nr:D-glycerate dehydrogenase [Lentibacillus sp. JNUCC-1]MUV37055.1 Glyoxylate reductase (NADP(+)) [Lentibacillus sp. JNUCC-1]